MNNLTKQLIYAQLFISACLLSCKNFIAIDPPVNQLTTQLVFSNDQTAVSAIRGIYARMINDVGFASGHQYSVTITGGLSADELNTEATNATFTQFAKNNLLPNNTSLRGNIWQDAYKSIYGANAMLENLDNSPSISPAIKQQLTGEAKFIRAFCYFYLTNLFGEVPLILSTDYRINSIAKAATIEQIYQQIITDLKDAQNLLSEAYPSTERIRPNKAVATAFLARVYLYHKEWSNAETAATSVIDNTRYKLLDDLNQVFLKNSLEAIWQLSAASPAVNTWEGFNMILTSPPGVLNGIFLNPNLVNSFEPGDLRLTRWVGTYSNAARTWNYAYKYKIKFGTTPLNEYSMVFRLAEQYLIRAEARIHQNDIENGIRDLNIIRKRARAATTVPIPNPLPDLSLSLTQPQALLAVEKERRMELFTEWGHRWLDLKRTNRADALLAPLKGSDWQSTDVLYPMPATDILNNPNLKQNPGYQ